MTWGSSCPQCGRDKCGWAYGVVCEGSLERADACMRALAGISDPAAFVERAMAMEVLLRRPGNLTTSNVWACLKHGEIAAIAAEWTQDA